MDALLKDGEVHLSGLDRFMPREPGVVPVAVLGDVDARRLMDVLWNVGVRPSPAATADFVGHEAQVQMLARHLEDLRMANLTVARLAAGDRR